MPTIFRNWGIPIAILLMYLIGRHFYFLSDIIAGDSPPDFEYVDLSGEKHFLSEHAGQNVILHFWGSWCGPCRKENKDLVRIMREADSDLKIISIGIEKDKNRWETAIRVDSLFWKDQYSDIDYFNSPIAKAYDVKSIPSIFLINENGSIELVNPTIKQIEDFAVGD